MLALKSPTGRWWISANFLVIWKIKLWFVPLGWFGACIPKAVSLPQTGRWLFLSSYLLLPNWFNAILDRFFFRGKSQTKLRHKVPSACWRRPWCTIFFLVIELVEEIIFFNSPPRPAAFANVTIKQTSSIPPLRQSISRSCLFSRDRK